MRKTNIRLSDGRELMYFDREDAPIRAGVDQRGLEPGSTSQGEMRFDALTGQWVSIAGHRQSRIFLPDASSCPLCPSAAANLSEIPESDYDVVVFENRFPSFLLGQRTDLDLVDSVSAPAYGRCEVIAYSSNHAGSLADLDATSMSLVMDAWVDRTRELEQVPGIRYVFVFENRGADVGVTLHHPHGQVYAYPFVPPYVDQLLERAQADPGLLAKIVTRELDDGSRVVHLDDHWVAFVPFASRWPYEVQIHPREARGSLIDLRHDERAAFVEFYPRLIRALDTIFDAPFPYMSGWHQRPAHATEQEAADSRLFLRLISNRRAADKLKFLASSESLMGAFIGDVVPEDAAARVRAALEVQP